MENAYGLSSNGAPLNVTVEYIDGYLDSIGFGGGAPGNATMTLDSADVDIMMAAVTGGDVEGQMPGVPISGQELVAHEMVHVMQFVNGLPATPTWFSEGAAESLSNSGQARVASMIPPYADEAAILDAASFFNAATGAITDTWNGSNEDYAGAYLLAQTINDAAAAGDTTGAGIKDIFDELQLGNDFATSINNATGTTADLIGADLAATPANIINNGGYETANLTGLGTSGADLSTLFGEVTFNLSSVADISVTATKDGNFLIANPGNGIIQKYDASGNDIGNPITIDIKKRQMGNVAALHDGGFIVLNSDKDDTTLYATRYSANGSLFEEFQVNNGRNLGNIASADIAVLSDGSFVVEWNQASDNETDESSYMRKFDIKQGIQLQVGSDQNMNIGIEVPNLEVQNHEIIGSYKKSTYDSDNNLIGETEQDVRWSTIIDSNKLNVTSDDIIGIIDIAVNHISKSRAQMAAQQNRLNNTREGLLNYSDNLASAESSIRDVDMARESLNFSSKQIISNASNAMLSQANGLPQSILQLLG